MFWNYLLLAAIVGIVGAILSKCRGGFIDILKHPVSYLLPGAALGIVLVVVMFFFANDLYICGLHAFWVGLIIGTSWEVFKTVRYHFC